KVTDFGLARADGTAALESKLVIDQPRIKPDEVPAMLDSPLTQAGALVGTPAYMAPEQILAKATDARTDEFSFCVALFEALYGERPFTGKTIDEMFDSTLAGLPPTAGKRRGIPGHVRAAIRRGLSVQPADRYPSMD